MPSQLVLHRTFAECESEELRKIDRLQGVFCVVFADAEGGLKAYSSNLTEEQALHFLTRVPFAELSQNSIPSIVSLPATDALVHTTDQGDWCFEFDPSVARCPVSEWPLPDAIPNVARFAQQLCDQVYETLPYTRVLVYRFHDDDSGEVIAERIEEGAEPFIGLHYPATDIPRQARELYSKLNARMVFSNHDSAVTLVSLGPDLFDLTQVVSRAVSPFHLQYLQNMGSLSTASVGIEVDGKLWGLLSLHSEQALRPSLMVYSQLANLKNQLSEKFTSCAILAEDATAKRNHALVERFDKHLSSEFDLAFSMLLSGFALHRLVGGVGSAVMVGNKVAQVGETLSSLDTRALFERLFRCDPVPLFCDDIHEQTEFQGSSLGGYAFVPLSSSPLAGLLIFRRQVVQSVSWGGDPRNAVVAGGDGQPYTPRASFERWTELVQGQCIPWEDRTVQLLRALIDGCRQRFEANPGAMGSLLDYSLQQMVHTRTRILQRLNEQFEQLRQGIAIAMQTGDDNFRSILSINYAASIAFNMSTQEAEGMAVDAFANTTSIPLEALENGSTTQVSVWTNDAGHRDLEVEVQQQFDYQTPDQADGLTIQIFYLTDITQSKRVEMALHAAYRKSERLAAAQNEMFAKLMHEMRTPLNSIIGFSSFLSDPSLEPVERDDFIERVVRNARSLQGLLKNSREHIQVLRNEIDHSNDVCLVKTVIQEVVEDLALTASERAIEIELDLLETDVQLNIPSVSLRQIISNLVTNALKFSRPGQMVSVVTEHHFEAVTIKVIDRGIGMSEEQVRDAFEPFVRFTETTGSGLGLSIVKQLVQAVGGTVEIQSELGFGTTIDLEVPVSKDLYISKAPIDAISMADEIIE